MGDPEYAVVFYALVLLIIIDHKPDYIFVSAGEEKKSLDVFIQGFDAAFGDPVGTYKVTPGTFGLMIKVSKIGAVFICNTIHSGVAGPDGRRESSAGFGRRLRHRSQQSLRGAVRPRSTGPPAGWAQVIFMMISEDVLLKLIQPPFQVGQVWASVWHPAMEWWDAREPETPLLWGQECNCKSLFSNILKADCFIISAPWSLFQNQDPKFFISYFV